MNIIVFRNPVQHILADFSFCPKNKIMVKWSVLGTHAHTHKYTHIHSAGPVVELWCGTVLPHNSTLPPNRI